MSGAVSSMLPGIGANAEKILCSIPSITSNGGAESDSNVSGGCNDCSGNLFRLKSRCRLRRCNLGDGAYWRRTPKGILVRVIMRLLAAFYVESTAWVHVVQVCWMFSLFA